MKFNVRVRIIDPHKRAVHEEQVYEADSGLEAMHKAQADEKNTSRGLVQTNGADPIAPEPIMLTKGEEPLAEFEPEIKHVADDEFDVVTDKPKRGRPPKHQTTPAE
jgi:hypothetical protein